MIGKSQPRARILMVGVLTTAINRVLAAFAPLVIVPLALHALGVEGYAVWAIAISFSAVIGFADLGVGSALISIIGSTGLVAGQEPDEQVRKSVSAAYCIAGAASAAILVGTLICYELGVLSGILGTESEDLRNVQPILLITLGTLAINVVLTLAYRVQTAMGQQGQANAWQSLASLLSVVAAYAVVKIGLGPVWFVAGATLTPSAIALMHTILFYRREKFELLEEIFRSQIKGRAFGQMVYQGGRFVVISLLAALALSADPWIVGRFAGLGDATNFVIPNRIFLLWSTVGVMLAAPLWPLHARAVRTGDLQWLGRTTLWASVGLSFTIGSGCVFTVLFGRDLLDAWLGDDAVYNASLWSGLASFVVVQVALAPVLMAQNSAEILVPQMIGYFLLVVTTVPVKIWVVSNVGIEWMPWVNTLGFGVVLGIASAIGFSRVWRIARSAREDRYDASSALGVQ